MPNGTIYADRGHLAGDTLVLVRPDGTAILRNKMSQSWQDTMQLIAAAVAAYEGAQVAEAGIAASKATDLAAQRTAASVAKSKAGLQELKVLTDLEKFKILHPEVLPVVP